MWGELNKEELVFLQENGNSSLSPSVWFEQGFDTSKNKSKN